MGQESGNIEKVGGEMKIRERRRDLEERENENSRREGKEIFLERERSGERENVLKRLYVF